MKFLSCVLNRFISWYECTESRIFTYTLPCPWNCFRKHLTILLANKAAHTLSGIWHVEYWICSLSFEQMGYLVYTRIAKRRNIWLEKMIKLKFFKRRGTSQNYFFSTCQSFLFLIALGWSSRWGHQVQEERTSTQPHIKHEAPVLHSRL